MKSLDSTEGMAQKEVTKIKMRPAQIRCDYVKAKARIFRKSLKRNPSIQFKRVLKNHRIRLEYILDLHRPFVIKYRDYYIIALPPLESNDQTRQVVIEQFAHVFLRHFEIYSVHKIIGDLIIKTLNDNELELLKKETQMFAREVLTG